MRGSTGPPRDFRPADHNSPGLCPGLFQAHLRDTRGVPEHLSNPGSSGSPGIGGCAGAPSPTASILFRVQGQLYFHYRVQGLVSSVFLAPQKLNKQQVRRIYDSAARGNVTRCGHSVLLTAFLQLSFHVRQDRCGVKLPGAGRTARRGRSGAASSPASTRAHCAGSPVTAFLQFLNLNIYTPQMVRDALIPWLFLPSVARYGTVVHFKNGVISCVERR